MIEAPTDPGVAEAAPEEWARPEYVKRQIDLIQEGLTQVLFDDYSVVIQTDPGDPIWGNLAMHINVAINAARNAIARAEKSEAIAAMRLDLEKKNRELEVAVDTLRRRNEELDAFVRSCSHDLQTPLVSLEGIVGIVLEEFGGQLGERGAHYLGRIQSNVAHLAQLITDLRQVAVAGREGLPSERIDLERMVGFLVAELRDRLAERGIEIVIGELHPLHGVAVHAEQVMRNLIGNAVKYLGDAPSPRIEVGSALHERHVECWVKDNGIGIDPAYHDKVFEVFQRLHDVKVDGTGIGLAIVKKIVESVGGRVWVDSALGQGATFRFTWPRA
jgi:signal transduction histidine kinase